MQFHWSMSDAFELSLNGRYVVNWSKLGGDLQDVPLHPIHPSVPLNCFDGRGDMQKREQVEN